MGLEDPKSSRQLRTLQRWRAVELDEAQTQYVQAKKVTMEREARADEVSSSITELHEFARGELNSGRTLSLDSLRRLADFASRKADELSEAQSALQASIEVTDKAHSQVLEQFEQLSVVERLGERRAVEASKDLARRDQKRLDEHALARLSIDIVEHTKINGES
jgi:flagellar export protein FliJ